MTEIERMVIRQAVELLEKVAVTESRSLYSVVDDYCTTPSERLFVDYISEDEDWCYKHLTEGIINAVRDDLRDYGYRLPE